MRRYLFAVATAALFSLLVTGCQDPVAATKPKRDPRYVDAVKYYGVYVGTPTEAAKGQEEAILQIRPAAMWVMKRNGMYLVGTYQYLSGELELGFRGIDGISITDLAQIERQSQEAVAQNRKSKTEPDTIDEYLEVLAAKNKAAGRKPDSGEQLKKYLSEWRDMYWRFTVQPDGYTMKDSERGPGLYVFKRAPNDYVMPDNVYSRPSSAQPGPRNVAGV